MNVREETDEEIANSNEKSAYAQNEMSRKIIDSQKGVSPSNQQFFRVISSFQNWTCPCFYLFVFYSLDGLAIRVLLK